MSIDKIQIITSLDEHHNLSNQPVCFSFSKNLPENAHFLQQTHSTTLVQAGEHTSPTASQRTCGDAIYTNSNFTIAIKTADCLPILAFDKNTHTVMAIHAGWKGLANSIVKKSLKKLHPQKTFVILGPCISKKKFSLKEDVITFFREKPSYPHDQEKLFLEQKENHWQFDLSIYAVLEILSLNIPAQNISILKSCTFSNQDLWHSYRRDKKCGRNYSWIKLAKDKSPAT
jgi:polyphenol oxidase